MLGGGCGVDWGVGSQGGLSEERDLSAEPWWRGVWWGEFWAAETVDTKLRGGGGVRKDQRGSGRFTGNVDGTDGKWTRTRELGSVLRAMGWEATDMMEEARCCI